jgi:hypothetical protein
MAVKVTEEKFELHPDALTDIVLKQAGTLWKAASEAVMNSVDARATRIDVIFTREQLMVSDNGRGFKDKQEIDTYFKLIGQRRDRSDKTYGQFGMGRAQMFGYGRNYWRTGIFKFNVDFPRSGDKWTCEEGLEVFDGCTITIDLDKTLSVTRYGEYVEEFKTQVKYCPVPIYLNGDLITATSSSIKWDYETEDADIKLRQSGDLVIYNQGIRICTLPHTRLGIGGDVVSKGKLDVNYARNEIMEDCPVWARIRRTLDQRATERNVTRSRVTSQDRIRMARQIADNAETANRDERNQEVLRRTASLPVFPDYTGKCWSYNQIVNRWTGNICICHNKDRRDMAKYIMDHGLSFVLRSDGLERFNANNLDALIQIFNKHNLYKLKTLAFEELSKRIDSTYTLVEDKDLNLQERMFLRIIEKTVSWLLWRQPETLRPAPQKQKFKIGISKLTDVWTDGKHYIAINRELVKKLGLNPSSWSHYGILIIQAYCHTTSGTSTAFSKEFYEKFHAWVTHEDALPSFFFGSVRGIEWGHFMESKKFSKGMAKNIDRVERGCQVAIRAEEDSERARLIQQHVDKAKDHLEQARKLNKSVKARVSKDLAIPEHELEAPTT